MENFDTNLIDMTKSRVAPCAEKTSGMSDAVLTSESPISAHEPILVSKFHCGSSVFDSLPPTDLAWISVARSTRIKLRDWLDRFTEAAFQILDAAYQWGSWPASHVSHSYRV